MTTTTFKRPTTCRKCGAIFEGSRTGYTVRCPACRGHKAPAAIGAFATYTCQGCGKAFRHAGFATHCRTCRPHLTAPAMTTCFCGKTVVATNGVPNGTTCPRRCHA